MTWSAAFVSAFALLAIALSGLAIVRIIQAEDLTWKPLWLIGSLLGFIGFGVDPRAPGNLFFHVGLQIPVVQGLWSSVNGLWLKAMFPVVAFVVLVKLEAPIRN